MTTLDPLTTHPHTSTPTPTPTSTSTTPTPTSTSTTPLPHHPPLPAGSPWPADTHLTDSDILVSNVSLTTLAARYGTPFYLLSEPELRSRARAYRRALPNADIHYAAKAFLCKALVRWLHEEGLGLDVCSGNELALALTCGFPPDRVIVHGNAKSDADLRQAVDASVGRVVLDSYTEIAHLAALARSDRPQAVYLRVIPGIAAGHHAAVRTGTDDQKFGFRMADGIAADAAGRVLAQPTLRLAGLHCHLGSQIAELEPFLDAVDRLVSLLALLRDRYGALLEELDLGGGHAIAYRPGEHGLDLDEFAAHVTARLTLCCALHGLPVPRLVFEPGRAIVGPAGVAVYRVLAIKRGPGSSDGPGDPGSPGGSYGTPFVAVDGGMSDNPRPALYGAEYTAHLLGRASDEALHPAKIVGHHCEAGDVLVDDARLPADVRPGDLIAMPSAGAYQLSMASTYNLTPRPPLIAVRDGEHRLIQRRETFEDLLSRDLDG